MAAPSEKEQLQSIDTEMSYQTYLRNQQATTNSVVNMLKAIKYLQDENGKLRGENTQLRKDIAGGEVMKLKYSHEIKSLQTEIIHLKRRTHLQEELEQSFAEALAKPGTTVISGTAHSADVATVTVLPLDISLVREILDRCEDDRVDNNTDGSADAMGANYGTAIQGYFKDSTSIQPAAGIAGQLSTYPLSDCLQIAIELIRRIKAFPIGEQPSMKNEVMKRFIGRKGLYELIIKSVGGNKSTRIETHRSSNSSSINNNNDNNCAASTTQQSHGSQAQSYHQYQNQPSSNQQYPNQQYPNQQYPHQQQQQQQQQQYIQRQNLYRQQEQQQQHHHQYNQQQNLYLQQQQYQRQHPYQPQQQQQQQSLSQHQQRLPAGSLLPTHTWFNVPTHHEPNQSLQLHQHYQQKLPSIQLAPSIQPAPSIQLAPSIQPAPSLHPASASASASASAPSLHPASATSMNAVRWAPNQEASIQTTASTCTSIPVSHMQQTSSLLPVIALPVTALPSPTTAATNAAATTTTTTHSATTHSATSNTATTNTATRITATTNTATAATMTGPFIDLTVCDDEQQQVQQQQLRSSSLNATTTTTTTNHEESRVMPLKRKHGLVAGIAEVTVEEEVHNSYKRTHIPDNHSSNKSSNNSNSSNNNDDDDDDGGGSNAKRSASKSDGAVKAPCKSDIDSTHHGNSSTGSCGEAELESKSGIEEEEEVGKEEEREAAAEEEEEGQKPAGADDPITAISVSNHVLDEIFSN